VCFTDGSRNSASSEYGSIELVPTLHIVWQGYFVRVMSNYSGAKNPKRQIAQAVEFCTMAQTDCGSSLWDLLHINYVSLGFLGGF